MGRVYWKPCPTSRIRLGLAVIPLRGIRPLSVTLDPSVFLAWSFNPFPPTKFDNCSKAAPKGAEIHAMQSLPLRLEVWYSVLRVSHCCSCYSPGALVRYFRRLQRGAFPGSDHVDHGCHSSIVWGRCRHQRCLCHLCQKRVAPWKSDLRYPPCRDWGKGPGARQFSSSMGQGDATQCSGCSALSSG